jgi:formylglycine-generating enzyme required for sulfatase activity
LRSFVLALASFAAALACTAAESAAVAGDQMVTIPAGSFTMGSDDGPEDERPAHRIDLPAFAIDRLPVTNAQFAEFLNASGTRNPKGERLFDDDDVDARIHRVAGRWVADRGFEQHPVVEVSWTGARDYCAWRGGRLPSEPEWEKAARGSDGRRYPWGNEPPDKTRAQFAVGWNETAAVDAHPRGASPYGVLDMAGNAWEWVSSAYRPYPYRADDGREDPDADAVRGTRGGGHDSRAAEITTTQRGRTLSRAPRGGHHNIGFRCAR